MRKHGEETLTAIPVIVTGASGRVGRILKACHDAGPPPDLRFVWSSRSGGKAASLAWEIGPRPAPAWPQGAILLHLAGSTGARDPAANPRLIAPLIAACRQNRLHHLVFLSSAAVCAPGPLPARESDPPAPANAYGAAKLEAERLLQASGLPLTIIRLGNLAGADALLAPREGREGREKLRLDPVPGDARGPLRSWIGPLTFGRTIIALLARIAAGAALPQVINLAQAPALGMAELLNAAGLPWEWGEAPAPVPAAMLDNGLLQSLMPLPAAEPHQIIAEIRALFTILAESQRL